MTALPKLLPCPFCGGDARLLGDEFHGYITRCRACKAATGYGTKHPEKSAEAWNLRFDMSIRKSK